MCDNNEQFVIEEIRKILKEKFLDKMSIEDKKFCVKRFKEILEKIKLEPISNFEIKEDPNVPGSFIIKVF
jgi:hypothetical protein